MKYDFTPGPWEIFNDNADMQAVAWIGCSNIDGKDYQVGQRHTQIHGGDAIGDARLISCAPEMVEILIQTVKDYKETGWGHSVAMMMKWIDIIEKATGEKWEC